MTMDVLDLPEGTWISFGHFPREASAEQFQAWLLERQIDVPLTNIAIKACPGNPFVTEAVISVANQGWKPKTVFEEVRRRVGGRVQFMGKNLKVFCPGVGVRRAY
jgi:hypothetical protein